MPFELSDDGTMDTVMTCSECGTQVRFTYQPGPESDEQGAELRAADPALSEDAINARLYDDWVASCIEEADADHACTPEDE